MAELLWMEHNTFLELAYDAPATIMDGCQPGRKPVSCPCSFVENDSVQTTAVTKKDNVQTPTAVPKLMLVLDDMIATREQQALPSRGSADHALGQCMPCAFFHKSGGCSLGFQCEFCHLCDSEERRKRKREKVARLRARRNASLSTSC